MADTHHGSRFGHGFGYGRGGGQEVAMSGRCVPVTIRKFVPPLEPRFLYSYTRRDMRYNRSAMSRPSPFELFCAYHLGLDREFRYRFFNLNSMARYFSLTTNEVRQLLEDFHLRPEDTRHVPFNVARAHATAQELAEQGNRLEVELFARKAFEEYMQSLGGYDPLRDFEEVDYDRIVPGQEGGSDQDPGSKG